MQEYSYQTTISARYLLHPPSASGPVPLLVGFHGYGERAEDALGLLSSIPGSAGWLCCAVEALHSFYRPDGSAGASWMTGRNREERIAENVHYVDGVIDRIKERFALQDRLVFHGFSQGVGMAWRAALLGRHRASALLLLGGDIPPELDLHGCTIRVHLARGNRDRIYSQEQFEHDKARLQHASIPFSAMLFSGGHKAGEEYFSEVSEFLSAE
ncbi:phospholipase [Chlorobium sp. BLA1]|uniref:alpha/beta hydrolase n=1 Tax=Candidatus Chlorobium masyuteum TaxID=2716876 RepID=UPI00141DCDEF|nr:phospholipase [Candidatus Chlorobium masyuteum]NHQ59741.1 phospholipase [Candidatus Chlorobium masyuteum]